jgi:hypothetical protein
LREPTRLPIVVWPSREREALRQPVSRLTTAAPMQLNVWF